MKELMASQKSNELLFFFFIRLFPLQKLYTPANTGVQAIINMKIKTPGVTPSSYSFLVNNVVQHTIYTWHHTCGSLSTFMAPALIVVTFQEQD